MVQHPPVIPMNDGRSGADSHCRRNTFPRGRVGPCVARHSRSGASPLPSLAASLYRDHLGNSDDRSQQCANTASSPRCCGEYNRRQHFLNATFSGFYLQASFAGYDRGRQAHSSAFRTQGAHHGFHTMASTPWLPHHGFHTMASTPWLPHHGFKVI